MRASLHKPVVLTALAMLAAWGVSGCSTARVDSTVLRSIQPYRFDRVQGNVVTREQAAALRVGMSRQQVREVLGTPLLNSVFHSDRWDYVFTLERQGVDPQQRHFAVFFRGDVLDHFDAAELPSEAEFVASIPSKKLVEKPLPLEAAPESLQAFAPPARPAPPAAALPPPPDSYPPLEPPAR